MACRISKKAFLEMAQQEADKLRLKRLGTTEIIFPPEPGGTFNLAEVETASPDGAIPPTAMLNRKAIQSLVDEAEQARPIVRNLLAWAKAHGAR
jgi:hypothetical protein